MTLFKNLPYRRGVGICLFNREGRVFVGERIDSPGAWQMPQGGIDDGEDAETAFFREMLEEIGCAKATILKTMDTPLFYDLSPELQTKLWGGLYRGQEQIWIAASFDGEDADINLNAHAPAEFERWQWVDLARLADMIVPFKRQTYLKVIEAFNDIPLSFPSPHRGEAG